MSSLMLVLTKCKKKFEDRRRLTQHQLKPTMCRAQNALNINVNLVNDDATSPADLLAFLCCDLTKHHQALAKNPSANANLPSQQPQIDKTSAAKSTRQKQSFETMSEDDDISDVDFAAPIFDNENAGAPGESAVASQLCRVSDPSDINWIRNCWIEHKKWTINCRSAQAVIS